MIKGPAPKPFGKDLGTREIVTLLIASLVLELIQFRLLPSYLHVRFLLIVILYIGWYGSPLKSAVWGTVFGITTDYLLGIYLGLNGMSKTILGFSTSYVSQWVANDSAGLRFGYISVASVIDQLIVIAMLLLLGEHLSPGQLVPVITGSIVTGIAGTVFFQMYDKIRFPPMDFRRL